MHIESTEMLWFEQHVLSLPELSELSGVPQPLLEELLDCGAIAPLEPDAGTEPRARAGADLRFGAQALRAARTARRLRADFEFDVQALAVALSLLDRVAELEAQLRELRAQQPQRVR
ncbi:MAG: chaperone modulator CbpM [Steroidobacterales bacterium]